MTRISLFTAMIIVFTVAFPRLTVPVIGINFTLQTLIVMLAACVLKPIDAFVSMFLYLIIGAIGIPVFSGPIGGIGVIIGPKGGFYLAFPIVAFLISYFNQNKRFINMFLANLLFGIILLYFIGSIWLSFYLQTNVFQILKSMLVFIPSDLIKALIATMIGLKLKDVIK